MNAFEAPLVSEAILLLDEFNYRTRNELASAIGLVSFASATSSLDEARIILRRVHLRLENYTRLQHTLRYPRHSGCVDAAAQLRQLCVAIRRSRLEGTDIELVCDARPVFLLAARSWRLSVIASELIGNACRHAFSGGAGTIRVDLASRDGRVECRIMDDGYGSNSLARGRGLAVIAVMLKGLEGALQYDSDQHGTLWIIDFPLEPQRAPGAGVIQLPASES